MSGDAQLLELSLAQAADKVRSREVEIIPLAWSMDTAGPMTRTVHDCALMFGVMAGHDNHDPASAARACPDYLAGLNDGVRGLRIGVVPGYFFAEPSTYHQRWLRERPQDYGEDVRALLEVGELLLATHYLQAQRYRTLLRNEFLAAFRKVDVFVCPTLPFTATKLGATTVVIEGGVEEDMLSAIMQFTGVPSLTGLPSLNVPCGFDGEGMPIGMQIIGRPFDEAGLFRIGHAFQSVTQFHTRAPKL